jgi:hypothetical protein
MTRPIEAEQQVRSPYPTGRDWVTLIVAGFLLAQAGRYVGRSVGHEHAGSTLGDILMYAVLLFPVMRVGGSWWRAALSSLTIGVVTVSPFHPGLLGNTGPIARVAIALWLAVVGIIFFSDWRIRANRRPDVPAWKFKSSARIPDPELYTAAGQSWLQRRKAASAVFLIGAWVVVGLALARV